MTLSLALYRTASEVQLPPSVARLRVSVGEENGTNGQSLFAGNERIVATPIGARGEVPPDDTKSPVNTEHGH